MTTAVTEIQRIADRYLREEASASMVVMELIQLTEDPSELARTLPTLAGQPTKLRELARHLAENKAGCHTVINMIRQRLDSPEPAPSVQVGIERCQKLFDASVVLSEESSVALYALGSSDLLAVATDEVVNVLNDWGVLGHHRDALEVGCGIARLMVPLSKQLRSVVGTDISQGMIDAATRRLNGIFNASIQLTDGTDLSAFPAGSFDLVYSVDTFPYLALSGYTLVERHFQEIWRVLRPSGHFVLFNYAYGRSREDINAEVLALAHAVGLQVVRADVSPFRMWNGIGWMMRRE